MRPESLRVALASTLSREDSSSLRRLGQAVSGDGCWGTLVQALEDLNMEEQELLIVFHTLAELGDARALILFLSAVRTKTGVLEAMLRQADTLPRAVQCALVTCPECEHLLEGLPAYACAAALELAADRDKRRSSRTVHEAHIGALRSMRWGSAPRPSLPKALEK